MDIGIKDIIDILLVAIMLFYGYKLMRKSRSVYIFYGVLIFASAWIFVSKVLEMKLLGSILDQLVSVGAIALIILFQEEIRHFFYSIGTHDRVRRMLRWFRAEHNKGDKKEQRHSREDIFPIVMACLNMSKKKEGALIIMQNDLSLSDIARSGEVVDARISQRLIENIFFKNTPLHDGALIIAGNRLTAAACILPISHDMDIPKEFGLRHRAAKGISEETDCLAIVVSEETGNITVAYGGDFRSHVSAEELEQIMIKGRF